MKIIIPAYEPDEKMLGLIREIKENSKYEIIIVDDGSSNQCQSIFREALHLGCIVLTHEKNRGKGAALKTAFSYALKMGEDEGLVCADCDGQHTWKDILKIATSIPYHEDAILLGSREFKNSIPFRSYIGNTITRGIFSLVSGNKIKDTQTGLRGFSAKLLPWLINIKGNRYEYEMNQLLEAKSAGFHLYNIPIQTIYTNNNSGSHFRPVLDSIKIYIPILKFCLSSISCGFIDFIALFLLNWMTHNLFFSVVGARIISSFCNYLLNKNIVFQTVQPNHKKMAFRYYLLVIFILACNYCLISVFTEIFFISLFFSKILTEFILFFVSFLMQRNYVFTK